MTRGDQRDRDRQKAQKKAGGQKKPKESASSLAKRKEADAEILRAKQKKKEEMKATCVGRYLFRRADYDLSLVSKECLGGRTWVKFLYAGEGRECRMTFGIVVWRAPEKFQPINEPTNEPTNQSDGFHKPFNFSATSGKEHRMRRGHPADMCKELSATDGVN
ncbi:hypothetical protein F5887DRAFT_1224568 [Amanita rubescens]|nr:hypothetical protein F5887DRAFT_1224568 [Amanita rubescens]